MKTLTNDSKPGSELGVFEVSQIIHIPPRYNDKRGKMKCVVYLLEREITKEEARTYYEIIEAANPGRSLSYTWQAYPIHF